MRRPAQAKDAVLSLEVQARLAPVHAEERSPFDVLVRHFLERFFHNEMASGDDEGKARLVQVACAVGLPGFMLALYLYPPYHDIRHARPYWDQVSDHYFYVVYSLVALAVATLFEWDFFFPDRLDVFVLTTLPVQAKQLFRARIAAVAIFVGGFLFDSNFLAPLVLPAAMEPPHLIRFLVAHVAAVAMSGIFAAAFVLALQGTLLSVLGEGAFRRISLLLQGVLITTLLTVLFLSPVIASVLREWVPANGAAMWFPPLWFLGVYQRLLEGPQVLPVLAQLARIGCIATVVAAAIAVMSYPVAYRRKVRGLIEGEGTRRTWRRLIQGMDWLNGIAFHLPVRRAVGAFASQTMGRVPRYRVYLAMYGGLGIALMASCAMRLQVVRGGVHLVFSEQGLHAAVAIAALWGVAGLRGAMLSPADRKGRWIFRVIRGKPGWDELTAARLWVLFRALAVSLAVVCAARISAPAKLGGWKAITVQLIVAAGLCLLATDALFLRVRTIPFTGVKAAPTTTRLALTLIQYLGIFPPLLMAVLGVERWMEASTGHVVTAAGAIVAAHLAFQALQRRWIAEESQHAELDEDLEEFPQTLGLRY